MLPMRSLSIGSLTGYKGYEARPHERPMAKVLITGGGGYIGQACAHAFLSKGWDVHLLDRVRTSSSQGLAFLIDQGCVLHQGDIRNEEEVVNAMQACTAVVHLAAISSVPQSFADPEGTMSVNVDGTETVLRVAEDLAVERVIIASSAAVYGAQTDMPLHEGMDLQTLSPYATSKQRNEEALNACRERGMNGIALRFFNVYGGHQILMEGNTSVIPSFIRTMAAQQAPHVLGDGLQSRDFIHVGDVALAVQALAEREAPYEAPAVNVCSNTEHGLLDIIDLIRKHLEQDWGHAGAGPTTHGEEREGDIRRSLGTNDLLRSLVEWAPAVSIDEGVREMVRMHMEGLER